MNVFDVQLRNNASRSEKFYLLSEHIFSCFSLDPMLFSFARTTPCVGAAPPLGLR